MSGLHIQQICMHLFCIRQVFVLLTCLITILWLCLNLNIHHTLINEGITGHLSHQFCLPLWWYRIVWTQHEGKHVWSCTLFRHSWCSTYLYQSLCKIAIAMNVGFGEVTLSDAVQLNLSCRKVWEERVLDPVQWSAMHFHWSMCG